MTRILWLGLVLFLAGCADAPRPVDVVGALSPVCEHSWVDYKALLLSQGAEVVELTYGAAKVALVDEVNARPPETAYAPAHVYIALRDDRDYAIVVFVGEDGCGLINFKLEVEAANLLLGTKL